MLESVTSKENFDVVLYSFNRTMDIPTLKPGDKIEIIAQYKKGMTENGTTFPRFQARIIKDE